MWNKFKLTKKKFIVALFALVFINGYFYVINNVSKEARFFDKIENCQIAGKHFNSKKDICQ